VSSIDLKSINGCIINDDKLKKILESDEDFKLFTIQQLEKISAQIRLMYIIYTYSMIILILLIVVSCKLNPGIAQLIK